MDTDSDGLNLLHRISQHKLKNFKFNELRPHLLAENIEIEPYKLNVFFMLFENSFFLNTKIMFKTFYFSLKWEHSNCMAIYAGEI